MAWSRNTFKLGLLSLLIGWLCSYCAVNLPLGEAKNRISWRDYRDSIDNKRLISKRTGPALSERTGTGARTPWRGPLTVSIHPPKSVCGFFGARLLIHHCVKSRGFTKRRSNLRKQHSPALRANINRWRLTSQQFQPRDDSACEKANDSGALLGDVPVVCGSRAKKHKNTHTR